MMYHWSIRKRMTTKMEKGLSLYILTNSLFYCILVVELKDKEKVLVYYSVCQIWYKKGMMSHENSLQLI